MSNQGERSDVELIADRVGQLADAIDELVGSNIQLLDLLVRRLERDEGEPSGAEQAGPVYLEDPAPVNSDSDGGEDA